MRFPDTKMCLLVCCLHLIMVTHLHVTEFAMIWFVFYDRDLGTSYYHVRT